MTKSRKVGIYLAIALVFTLALATIVPLLTINNGNVASAAPQITDTASTWDNPYSGSYYDNLNTDSGRWGATFYNDLASLITSTHKNKTSYDGLKTVFATSDADPDTNGNVIWFYTGDSIAYTGAMDSGNYPTNREHVWPKMGGSAFPEKSDAGSDAHHLRPLNTGLNNTRSNNHFGIVPQTDSNRVYQTGTLKNYGTSDLDSWCYQAVVNGSTYFYPAAGYRGATARILFYVQTRWGKGQATGDLSFTLGKGSARVMSNVDILLQWHLQEPPTEEEIRRNEAVAKIQGNRNPFIDHPEYAEMIYCHDGNSYNSTLQNVVKTFGSYLDNSNPGGDTTDKTPTKITLSASSLNLTVGQTSSQITVTATPSNASNSVTWSSDNTNVATVNNGRVTATGVGTATITATSTLDTSVKATLTVTVKAATVTPDPPSSNEFTEAMDELDSATTLQERYDAIKKAIDAYNRLSSSEKASYTAEYAKLQEAVNAYNAEIQGINNEFADATNVAAQAVALTISTAFLALVLIVVKLTVRR